MIKVLDIELSKLTDLWFYCYPVNSHVLQLNNLGALGKFLNGNDEKKSLYAPVMKGIWRKCCLNDGYIDSIVLFGIRR